MLEELQIKKVLHEKSPWCDYNRAGISIWILELWHYNSLIKVSYVLDNLRMKCDKIGPSIMYIACGLIKW